MSNPISLEGSATVFRLPRSHWHCSFVAFDWQAIGPTSVRSHVERFLEQALRGEGGHLVLTGPPGCGKTHLGVAIYRWLVLRVGSRTVTWLDTPGFCQSCKRAFDEPALDPWDDVQAATTLVVLDDLFGRDLSAFDVAQSVARVIDITYQNNASLVVTMNQDVSDLAARLGPHETSRVLAKATVIPLKATRDYRRQVLP